MVELMKRIVFFLIFILVYFIVFIFWYFENRCIKVSEIEISNNKISSEFDGYTIVQVSDLHNTSFGCNQSDLINKIKNQNPDIIVITGDLIHKRSDGVKYCLNFINQAVYIAPVYFVTGNHEERIDQYDPSGLYKMLINAGVIILNNKGVILNSRSSHINLFGINDPGIYYDDYRGDREIVNNILSNIKVNRSEFNILLSHRPEFIDIYSRYGYDLVFSGHAHGGQIRIPFLGGIWAPGQGFFPKYTQGKYAFENTTMVVSRGLGKSIVPTRIFNRPEIIVCKLKSN